MPIIGFVHSDRSGTKQLLNKTDCVCSINTKAVNLIQRSKAMKT